MTGRLRNGFTREQIVKQVEAYKKCSMDKMHAKPKRMQYSRLYLDWKEELRLFDEETKNGSNRD